MKSISAYDCFPHLMFLTSLLLLLPVNQARAHETCTSLKFARRPNQALAGHAFKTLELGVYQCKNKCAKTVGCFSMNTYQTESGVQQCELLRSTMKASPRDFVIKSGYMYYELTGCVLPGCINDKEAFPDGSYLFNSSVFKLYPIRKTWSAAKEFCESLGGNLASVNSETENTFLQQTMAAHMHINTLSGFPWSSKLVHWKLDGTDMDVKLKDGASYSRVAGITALDLHSGGYAVAPAVAIEKTSFTFACWIFVSSYGHEPVFSDWTTGAPRFLFRITTAQQVQLLVRHTSGSDLISAAYGYIYPSTWYHIGASWDRDTAMGQIFIDGIVVGSKAGSTNLDSLDVITNPRPVEDIGYKWNTNEKFSGYIGELIVFKKALTEKEMMLVRGSFDTTSGVWIGLNDVSSEGTFVWSDGSDETHSEWTSGEPNDAFSIEDCAVVTRDGKWEDNRCEKELPFICKTSPEDN